MFMSYLCHKINNKRLIKTIIMESKDKKLKSDVLTGVSSSAGAVTGVVIGSIVTEYVYAEPALVPVSEPEILSQSVSMSETDPVSRPELESVPEPEQVLTSQPVVSTPEPNPVHDVQVLAYETVPDDMGGQTYLAVVDVNGQPVVFADVDQDGMADVAAADVNCNGHLDPEEFIGISQDVIAIQPFCDEINGQSSGLLAQNDNTDYINDADVDDFMV